MTSPSIEDLTDAVCAAVSRLALREDIADTEAPDRVLYALAGALGALQTPVQALSRRATDRQQTEREQELRTGLTALRQAAQALERAASSGRP
jgi:hypothetical protein